MPSATPFLLPERRVRALRIRAPDGGSARRAAIALGDALHTASLDEGGGFVLIARVALGRIPADASSATLALLVERAVRATASRAAPGDHLRAGSADAVRFPDRATALGRLARRHARHEPAPEWFWNQIVPGWRAPRTRLDGWRLLLEAAHELDCPVVAAADVVHEAMEAGVVDECLRALSPSMIARWLRLGGWEPVPENPVVSHGGTLPSPTIHRMLEPTAGLAGATDVRVVWLVVMLAVHERPSRASIAALPAQIAAELRAAEHGLRNRRQRDGEAGTDLDMPRTSSAIPASGDEAAFVCDRKSALIGPRTPDPREPPARDRPRPIAERGEAVERPIEGVVDEPVSACAGLLFLIAILRRLGFAAYLRTRPELAEADFPLRLLHFIGRRAGMARADPLATILAGRMGEAARTLVDADCDWRLGAWFAAVRGWCRRRARLEWRAVVARRGRVRGTRTHLDVCFESRQADVAIRRLALDVDPGWVPWLGCVVRVHYQDTHGPGS